MTKTAATGKLSQQVSYRVKLFIAEAPKLRWRHMYRIRKQDPKTGKYDKEVDTKEDLLTLNTPLRLFIEDNAAWDGQSPEDKGEFYNKRKLMPLLNIFVPLRLELRKTVANKKVSMNKHDQVKAVFEIVDPQDEVDIVKGPRPSNPSSKTGKNFVESLRNKTQLGKNGGDDNCIQDFAPAAFRNRCRRKGSKVGATDVLYNRGKKRKNLGPLSAHPSESNLGVAPISWKRQRSRIGFHPPPILGDNYKLKINLVDEKLKNLLEEALFTPTITIWRRVKIQLVARQKGIKHNVIKWEEVRNAYRDAFIDVVGPPKKYRVIINQKKWVKYLENHVYRDWKYRKWKKYKTKERAQLRRDLENYSFPQASDLTPPEESDTDPDHTSLRIMKKLAKRIFRDNLPSQYRSKINDVRKGARIGLCVLLCHPPSSDPHWGGVYLASLGGKRFIVVRTHDVTRIFSHEMGHALFLNHGATKSIKDIDKPIIVGFEKSGRAGPFWDQHHSEDTIACLMSYGNMYYDVNGNKLGPSDNPTDWHFCGVCLLLLRFHSERRMSKDLKSDYSFRRLNYFKHKPRIAEALEMTMAGIKELIDWSFEKSLTMTVGEKRRLLAMYPQEHVINNTGKDFWKDICHHPRGSWVSSQPRMAKVNVKKSEDIWISELIALKPTQGNPVEIRFQIRYGSSKADVNESASLSVTVKRKLKKAKKKS